MADHPATTDKVKKLMHALKNWFCFLLLPHFTTLGGKGPLRHRSGL